MKDLRRGTNKGGPQECIMVGEYRGQKETVAVITRTKDSPVLLRRAIESVLSQTYDNWIHVIVNDGGDPKVVEGVVGEYRDQYDGRLRVLHNPVSKGMEAASNIGIQAVDSTYIVIHDDDDSWSPDFLRQAISALRWWTRRIPSVKGVVTHCARVIEHLEGNVIVTDCVEPFNCWLPAGILRFDLVLHQNPFPPIAFLYERRVWEELGGYCETLPVLGDWEFNVRFLCKYDIAVHPFVLAFYHHRPSAIGGLGNTVIAGVELHEQYRRFLLNKWLREDFLSGKPGIGVYVNLREHIANLLVSTHRSQDLLERMSLPSTRFRLSKIVLAGWKWFSEPGKMEKVKTLLYYLRTLGIRQTLQRIAQWAG